MKKTSLAIVFSSLLLSAQVSAETVDKIIAKVGSEVITQSDLNHDLKSQKEILAETYGEKDGAKRFAEYKANALSSMVLQRILEGEIKHEKISIGDDDVDREYRSRVSASRKTEPEYLSDLARYGLSITDYKETLRKQLAQQQFVDRKIRPMVTISDEALQSEYEKHKNDYITYKKFRFIEVFLTPDKFVGQAEMEKVATQIHDALSRNVSAKAMIQQYSSGAFKDNGGDSGMVAAADLRDEIRDVLTGLKPGETSQIFSIGQSVFIFKLLAKSEPEPLPFGAVVNTLRNRHAEQEVQRQLKKYLLSVKEQTYVEILP